MLAVSLFALVACITIPDFTSSTGVAREVNHDHSETPEAIPVAESPEFTSSTGTARESADPPLPRIFKEDGEAESLAETEGRVSKDEEAESLAETEGRMSNEHEEAESLSATEGRMSNEHEDAESLSATEGRMSKDDGEKESLAETESAMGPGEKVGVPEPENPEYEILTEYTSETGMARQQSASYIEKAIQMAVETVTAKFTSKTGTTRESGGAGGSFGDQEDDLEDRPASLAAVEEFSSATGMARDQVEAPAEPRARASAARGADIVSFAVGADGPELHTVVNPKVAGPATLPPAAGDTAQEVKGNGDLVAFAF